VFRVLDCLAQEHDYRLVVLALGVCALGSYAAITLLNHMGIVQERGRWGWLAAAAVASGFSIWATHFIAMLAFSPPGPTGYDFVLTLLSLVAAIAVTGVAYFAAIDGGLLTRAFGGALVGGGIATMHYTGMAAFRIAGTIVWDETLVAASIVLGCALGAAALVVGAGNTTLLHRLQGAVLLTLAIFSHHFTAMGAAWIVRDPTIMVAESALPPGLMAVGVAIGGLAILTLTLVGVVLDRRDRQRTAAFVRDIAAARKAEEQQNLLVAELDHRVKNVLARVAVVARRTREGSPSMDHFLDVLDGRIQSMANTHALLSCGRGNGVYLADLVHAELEPYMGELQARVEGPPVLLSAEVTQALAMVLHELVTNAAKYGALSTPRGQVCVRWGCRSNGNSQTVLTIRWQEIGGPPVRAPYRRGYGTSVISDLIPYELGGMVDIAYVADGIRCRIEFPLEQGSGYDRSTPLTASRSNRHDDDQVKGRLEGATAEHSGSSEVAFRSAWRSAS
jgi:NO-binding membrane sensor protein with MHYT domain/two-component sensor histidine kinase